MRQLGQVLLGEGLISPEQLRDAEEDQRRLGKSLGRILIDRKLVTEQDLVSALSKQIGMEFVDLAAIDVDPSAVSLISDAVAKRYNALPIGFEDGKLVVAMSDPSNVFAIDDIRTATGYDIRPIVATRQDIAQAISRYHRMSDDIGDVLAADLNAAPEEEQQDLSQVTAVVEDAPIVKFVNLLITQAVQDRASDIHIEPGEKEIRVRYRIDGVLHEVMRSPRSIQSGVISRLKIMAEMDIAERRIPQDGRIGLVIGGKAIDLRVSTLPTVYGEKVVMRILDKSSVLLELKDLGFLPENYERYETSFRKPYGMMLVTGPTGSGKSTTLYATLNILNRPEVNIITTEDPVEYRLGGINQVQVNVKAGLTFASALRSILRQDPDIVLVGETRDRETAQIAVEASLTGHLVLTTLHTNDAPSAIVRLTEMGIEPFLVGSAVDCVLAQRLARRLCNGCKEPYTPTPATLKEAGFPEDVVEARPEVFRAAGCSRCGKTGYRGRLAVHEVMAVTEEIERLCVERASSDEIMRVAVSQGMARLRQDGLAKIMQGDTTIEEIGRVVV
ncbi:MAG: type IV-A pilus assembly ATPase PilB [Actinobacteria bacterium]|nr:type IV-A pilus assembly ATPase PilB [Actinomycetota bacterium]